MFQRGSLFSLLIVGVAVAPALGQEAELKWKFDKPFYQTVTTTTNQNMKVMGTDVTQKQEQTFYFQWTPVDVKDDTKPIKLKQKIIGLKMNIDIGGSKITYDSTLKEQPGGNNPLDKFFQELSKAEFTLTIDPKTMKVTDLTGHKEFVDKLGDVNPQMKPLLEKILSKEALMQMAEPTFAAVPNKKVKKGESWKHQTSLDMGPIGKYDTTYTYTYEGPAAGDKTKDQKISVKTDLKYVPPDAKASGGGALPFKITSASLEGKDGTGTVIYDPDKGRVKSAEMSMTLAGKLTIEISGTSTEVELEQKQTTTIATSDENPIKKK